MHEIKRGTSEWYLYHHYKNEDALLIAIPLAFFAIFFKGGIGLEIIIWGYYAYYCWRNNRALDLDPKIQKERQAWLDFDSEASTKRYEELKKQDWWRW